MAEKVPPKPAFEQFRELQDASRQEEYIKLERRLAAAKQIADARWAIAQHVHRLEDGQSKLDFADRPYLREVYQSDALEKVIYGAAQWGKTEMLICDVAASAMYGMKCLVVMSTHNKRERFSKTRMDPCFEIVPEYRAAVQEAISRGQDYQSVRQKGFGGGTIALMAATVEREFTSVPGDAVWVDEHQECDQTVLPMLDDRMSGSWYRSKTFLGHPTVKGTRDNDNLDWLYQNSDQRLWNVPCVTCGRFQVLKWTTHVVHQKTNKNGAIIDLRPRDEEWKPGSRWDMRCICPFCHRPMNRFARNAKWVKNNPGHERHGFRLGNLSNPNKLLHQMFDAYVTARYSPRKMSEFVNKQLGETYSMDGTKIEEHILEMCASGENGIPPYKFYPVDQLMWRKQELEEAEY